MIMKKLLKKKAQPANDNVEQPQPIEGAPASLIVQIRTQHDAFMTMVRSNERNEKGIAEVLINWWPSVFAEPLPNDINANTAKLKIQYELMKRGYEKANVILPQRFADNYKRVFEGKETALDRCEKEGFLGNLTINKTNSIQKEDDMSERKLTPNSIIVSGLTDRKFTDEEIVANVQREFPDEKDTKHLLTRVFLVRSAINGGRMLKDWAEKNGRIEKLVRVDGKLVAKTTLPKAEPKRKAKPTVDPANDPLKKTAGIDLAKKPTAKDKAANVENKKAMPKKPVAKKPEAKVAPKVAAKKVNAPAKKKSEGVKV